MNINHKFAAIDIGTNAVRLLFYNIYLDLKGQPQFKKVALTRVPIRLGEDVFATNNISKKKIELLRKTLIAFKNLIDVHEVIDYMACATSAMREAENAEEVKKYLKKETGIEIKTITGDMEADLIYQNHIAESMNPNRAYLYIDVGGGSTELTLFYEGAKRFSESFQVGTVRMLYDKISKETWDLLKLKCIEIGHRYKNIAGIGSGGNVIKLQKLSWGSEGEIFSRSQLKEVYHTLKELSYEERIRKLGLNPDRADVIIPAAEIFLFITKHTEIKNIIVPKIGLSDGIIHYMYEEYLQKDKNFLDH
jgi:exopolyphosphatase / guanosine-5'-triphosphate,3'-diphosphate pyrophosphatase